MKKCCIRTCITALVFVVVIAIGVIVLLNLTPSQLHLADKSIAGFTLADYGLGDVKLIKIIKGARGLTAKEAKVVEHGFDATAEQTSAETLFANSNFAGADDYSQLVVSDASYDQHYLRGAADTTIAYVLDNVVAAAFTLDTGNGNKTAAMRVKEVAITKTENEGVATGHARVVMGISASSFVGNLDKISEIVGKVKIIKIPEYVFVVCTADFTINESGAQEGKIIFQNIKANVGADADNPLNTLLFGIINKAMGQETSADEDSSTAFASFVFDKVSAVINHVGKIGTASTSVDGKSVVVGSTAPGMKGVTDGKLFFITNKN